MSRPRIAILSADDTRSRNAWSGTPFYMAGALQAHCGDVVHLGPAFSAVELAARVWNRMSRSLLGRATPWQHAPGVARDYARTFRRRLRAAGQVDVIFAPAAATQLAMLETDIPVVYTSDATFELMRDYYPGFTGFGESYAAGGNEIEGRALRMSKAVIYPSEWAARSARKFYGVDPSRIHVVPYGANLDVVPDRDAVRRAKTSDRCSVLLLGVDWERKGGPIAYEAVHGLRERGIDATLTVCGCTPPEAFRAPWLRVVPRLDKSDPAQQRELSRLLLEANFLLLPARQECYGIVFCEASAHGTPSIAADTGGIGGAVARGRSGVLLPRDAGAGQYAATIASLFADRERYRGLVESSRAHYEDCVNWDRWGKRVGGIIDAVLTAGTGRSPLTASG